MLSLGLPLFKGLGARFWDSKAEKNRWLPNWMNFRKFGPEFTHFTSQKIRNLMKFGWNLTPIDNHGTTALTSASAVGALRIHQSDVVDWLTTGTGAAVVPAGQLLRTSSAFSALYLHGHGTPQEYSWGVWMSMLMGKQRRRSREQKGAALLQPAGVIRSCAAAANKGRGGRNEKIRASRMGLTVLYREEAIVGRFGH